MDPDRLPASCIALLEQQPPAQRTHPGSGAIVWTFGQLGPDRDLRQLGLLATQPGMYAENLPEHLGIPVAQMS